MTEPLPDLEIYLKRVEVADIINWLGDTFAVVNEVKVADTTKLKLIYNDQELHCHIVEKAARGGYNSVWFLTNITPWADDLGCARAAFDHFGVETRCAAWHSSAGDDEEDSDGAWIRLTQSGEATVNWRT